MLKLRFNDVETLDCDPTFGNSGRIHQIDYNDDDEGN